MARRGQRRIPAHVDVGELQLSLKPAPVGLPHRAALGQSLIERCRKRTRIDIEKHLALVYQRPFAIVLFDQISAHLRLDICIPLHGPIERRDPVARTGTSRCSTVTTRTSVGGGAGLPAALADFCEQPSISMPAISALESSSAG